MIFQKKKYKCPTPNCAATSKYRQNITKHVDLCYNVNKKKTENQNSKIYCHIENFHGTASSNEILMEDEGQEEKVPEKDQKKLPTLVPISIPEQEGVASIDFLSVYFPLVCDSNWNKQSLRKF